MKAKKQRNAVKSLATLAVFVAVIAVLQLVSAYIHIGPLSITLVLLPVVLGGALFGLKFGTVLGASFGVLTFIFSVMGIDPGGNMMFAANPLLTFLVCITKGILAGLLSAFIFNSMFKITSGKHFISYLAASFTAPTVNTGIFLLFAWYFYRPILQSWAGGTDVINYIFSSLVLLNYLPEMLFCVILCPIIGLRCQKTVFFTSVRK